MTEVFLSSSPVGSAQSALFVAWGQLLTIDMSLTNDNSSEAFPVPCDQGSGGIIDVWCPSGADSEPIPFFRSDASFTTDDDGALVRNPINYASAFLDLDFVYGRSEEEARDLRTMEGGMMNLTDDGLPFLNKDGTWKVRS